MTVATAASMDGYTAFGAAITKDGYKHTMTCPAPLAVLADLDVLRSAPARMTSSGYADLLGKVPAGADWLVADALEVERVNAPVWSLVQGPLREAIGSPAELHGGAGHGCDRGKPSTIHNRRRAQAAFDASRRALVGVARAATGTADDRRPVAPDAARCRVSDPPV